MSAVTKLSFARVIAKYVFLVSPLQNLVTTTWQRLAAASYPDVSLDVRAKEGGKETTGETSGRSCFQDGGKSNGTSS